MVLSDSDDGRVWQPVEVSLAFRLGELTLFERSLRGLADRRHFLQQSPHADMSRLIDACAGTDFFFLPIHPVEVPPPVVERRGQWVWYTPYTFRNYFIDFRGTGSFENYLAKFSAKTRSTLRRKVRRFEEASGGSIDFRVLRRPDEMDKFLRLALPLSAKTYQARLLDAGLPTSPRFASETKARAALGEVRGYLLLKDGRAAAYVFCFCADGVATYDYVGFDPALRELSAGTVLQYLLIEDMFRDGSVSLFDFMEGEGEHKALFATDSRLCAKTYVLRPTLRNRASVEVHRALGALSSSLGHILEHFGLKRRLRALIRRQV